MAQITCEGCGTHLASAAPLGQWDPGQSTRG